MTKTELWDYMTQEVREYMGMRYFQTTRCLLTAEQIDHICESELAVLESYKKKEEIYGQAHLESMGLKPGDKVTIRLHEYQDDSIHCFQTAQECECYIFGSYGLDNDLLILRKKGKKKELRFNQFISWDLIHDGKVVWSRINPQNIIPGTYTDEELARIRIRLSELQKL